MMMKDNQKEWKYTDFISFFYFKVFFLITLFLLSDLPTTTPKYEVSDEKKRKMGSSMVF